MMNNCDNRKSFIDEIRVHDNKQRLIALKRKLDDDEIKVESLSKEDINQLIELYDAQIADIKAETIKIKGRIKAGLQELKRS